MGVDVIVTVGVPVVVVVGVGVDVTVAVGAFVLDVAVTVGVDVITGISTEVTKLPLEQPNRTRVPAKNKKRKLQVPKWPARLSLGFKYFDFIGHLGLSLRLIS